MCAHRSSDDEGEAASNSAIPDVMPVSASDTDWRDFRARLVASTSGRTDGSESEIWVHPVPRAEAGCVLLAHPLMFTNSQEYFAQARIFASLACLLNTSACAHIA